MQTLMTSVRGDGGVTAWVAGRTHPGQRRPENQDAFLFGELSASEDAVLVRSDGSSAGDDVRLPVAARGLLLLVADGMGGAAGGRLASALACTFILTELQDGWVTDEPAEERQFARRLREAVVKANARIFQHAQRHPASTGMGCTATTVGVLGTHAFLAQVGDSRAYLTRGGATTQITRDQSLVQHMIEAGALRPEEAAGSVHANALLQALGAQPEVEVDLTYHQLRQDDLLVLCSDGLYRVVPPADITEVVQRLVHPAAICEQLIQLANARGGPDNVTAVAARFSGAALSIARTDDVVGRTVYPAEDVVPG